MPMAGFRGVQDMQLTLGTKVRGVLVGSIISNPLPIPAMLLSPRLSPPPAHQSMGTSSGLQLEVVIENLQRVQAPAASFPALPPV